MEDIVTWTGKGKKRLKMRAIPLTSRSFPGVLGRGASCAASGSLIDVDARLVLPDVRASAVADESDVTVGKERIGPVRVQPAELAGDLKVQQFQLSAMTVR